MVEGRRLKLVDDQLADFTDALLDDRKEELLFRLRERGKLAGIDESNVRAEIDRLFQLAFAGNITSAHECARFVEFFFALSADARASATCKATVIGVLANAFAPASVRVDFLIRHVLPKTDWPD